MDDPAAVFLHASPLLAPGGGTLLQPNEALCINGCLEAAGGRFPVGSIAVANRQSVVEALRGSCSFLYLSGMSCDQTNLWVEDATGRTDVVEPSVLEAALRSRPDPSTLQLAFLPFCWSEAVAAPLLAGGARRVVSFRSDCGGAEQSCGVTDYGASRVGAALFRAWVAGGGIEDAVQAVETEAAARPADAGLLRAALAGMVVKPGVAGPLPAMPFLSTPVPDDVVAKTGGVVVARRVTPAGSMRVPEELSAALEQSGGAALPDTEVPAVVHAAMMLLSTGSRVVTLVGVAADAAPVLVRWSSVQGRRFAAGGVVFRPKSAGGCARCGVCSPVCLPSSMEPDLAARWQKEHWRGAPVCHRCLGVWHLGLAAGDEPQPVFGEGRMRRAVAELAATVGGSDDPSVALRQLAAEQGAPVMLVVAGLTTAERESQVLQSLLASLPADVSVLLTDGDEP